MEDNSIDEQLKIKWNLLNNEGGYCTIYAEYFEDESYLFFIENTLICFELINWEEYFIDSQIENPEQKYLVNIKLISIAPTTISNNGPYIGEAIITNIIYPN